MLSDFTARDFAIVGALFSLAALFLYLAYREHCHQAHLRALKREALNGRKC